MTASASQDGPPQEGGRPAPWGGRRPGSGRPEIGGKTRVHLGGMLALVDDWAARHGVTRAEAVRTLIRRGLQSENETTQTGEQQ